MVIAHKTSREYVSLDTHVTKTVRAFAFECSELSYRRPTSMVHDEEIERH